MEWFEKKNKKGVFADVIRCEESSYLIWKWRSKDAAKGENMRENAVRRGSVIHVREGEAAVLVYEQKSGEMQELLIGPCEQMMETANFPVLTNIFGKMFGGDSPFMTAVYFINLTPMHQIRFGVPFFRVYDHTCPENTVLLAIRGSIRFAITDCREFVRIHQLRTLCLEEFREKLRDILCSHIRDLTAKLITCCGVSYTQMEALGRQIGEMAQREMAELLREEYGIKLLGVEISEIEAEEEFQHFRGDSPASNA